MMWKQAVHAASECGSTVQDPDTGREMELRAYVKKFGGRIKYGANTCCLVISILPCHIDF
jgi:hypothetical protein